MRLQETPPQLALGSRVGWACLFAVPMAQAFTTQVLTLGGDVPTAELMPRVGEVSYTMTQMYPKAVVVGRCRGEYRSPR